MGFFMAKDTISGQEARAYTTIDGNVEAMFYAKNLKAEVEKNKTDIKTLGKRGTQQKAVGWNGTGSMTIYFATTMFRKMMLDYIKNGKDVYFDITVTNEDPTSSIGKQTTVLKNVNLNKVTVAQFDVDADALDEDIDFTFDDMDILDEFGKPVLG